VTVVCNTSPLLFLAKIQRLDLLLQLYTVVRIPVAVLNELSVKPDQEAEQIQAFVHGSAFELHHVTPSILADIPVTLGRGEREVIALALETAADLVILDDQQGHRYARARGITVTGTWVYWSRHGHGVFFQASILNSNASVLQGYG
jgi:uncharacterized protein